MIEARGAGDPGGPAGPDWPHGPVRCTVLPTGPAELARRARPAGTVLTPTTVVDAVAGHPPGHPLGVFARGLFDVADRPTEPSLPGPIRVPSDHLTTGQKQTAGTVFDVALRQRLGADINGQVRWVAEISAASCVPVRREAPADGVIQLTAARAGRPRDRDQYAWPPGLGPRATSSVCKIGGDCVHAA